VFFIPTPPNYFVTPSVFSGCYCTLFFSSLDFTLIVWVRCVLYTYTRRLVDSATKATGCGQATAKTGLDIHSFYFFMQDLNSCGFEYDLISIENRFGQVLFFLLSGAFQGHVLSQHQRANQITLCGT
jgi:hypothetical protein